MSGYSSSLSRRSALSLLAAPMLRAADDFPRLLARFVEPLGGELGFALHHVESGERIAIRGDERFAMASVYKLPIALTVLHGVDEGRLSLEQKIRLTPADLRLGLGNDEVARLVDANGHDFTVEDLLRRTLVDSDNASSDALLRLIGAPAATARMAALGVPEIRVDRQESQLLLDFVGASSRAPKGGWTVERLRERYRSATPEQRRRALAAFYEDPRDTTTPNAMAALLLRVHQRTVLKPDSGEMLLGLLEKCKTGANRLRGHLPANVKFLHRTGTSDTTDGVTAATNDVGILTLPERRGTVILAAFLRGCSGSMAERELVLARIGRAVFERYVGA